VVLVRASRIGDFICATPAFRALRHALPQAEISMITLPLLRDLALRSPHFDRIIPFPGYPGLAEQFFDARQAVQFFAAMQAEAFDLAIQMQCSGVNSNPFTLMLGAHFTAGFVRPGDGAGRLDAALPIPETGFEVERVLMLTTFLGAPSQGLATEFPLWLEDHTIAEELLQDVARPLIGIHPDARDDSRRWPPDRFGQVAAALQRRLGGTIVILGEAATQPYAQEVMSFLSGPVLVLTGRTSLAVLGAVIQRLAVLVTNDTGLAHIAYALGTPTVTLFGAGDQTRYGPVQPGPYRLLVPPCPCRAFDYGTCQAAAHCLDTIPPQQVVDAVEDVVARKLIGRKEDDRGTLM
jgi:ADP-heptose:LPS heptosyltransferase